jgi:hypothetical protein
MLPDNERKHFLPPSEINLERVWNGGKNDRERLHSILERGFQPYDAIAIVAACRNIANLGLNLLDIIRNRNTWQWGRELGSFDRGKILVVCPHYSFSNSSSGDYFCLPDYTVMEVGEVRSPGKVDLIPYSDTWVFPPLKVHEVFFDERYKEFEEHERLPMWVNSKFYKGGISIHSQKPNITKIQSGFRGTATFPQSWPQDVFSF